MLKLIRGQDRLTAAIIGEIDHHTARRIREETDAVLQQDLPHELIFDFSGVTFMDSSGIGLIMGRYRLVSQWGGSVTIAGAPSRIERILKMSGIEKLAQIHPVKEEEV
ncbi:anti-sigma factor antagonist [Phocea massiliensis]|uniref:Anti-sigma factor antagonist n=1 Tax=Merdimmobilis hominis TaxID=2897707 RepID=A0A939BF19_9FIRM|nr:anti-sigma factor antagonist [Merdimmobilis hominis]MBM6921955.1 anti-sigma factor antagonist [Merdimmobilis hominis]